MGECDGASLAGNDSQEDSSVLSQAPSSKCSEGWVIGAVALPWAFPLAKGSSFSSKEESLWFCERLYIQNTRAPVMTLATPAMSGRRSEVNVRTGFF